MPNAQQSGLNSNVNSSCAITLFYPPKFPDEHAQLQAPQQW
jgi:hypothetical protein